MKTKAARHLNKGERAVLLPGATGAEPWEAWLLGASGAECARVCAQPSENPWRRTGTLALPVGQVFCLPLWFHETDPKQIAGLIPLQLELRGLQPRLQSVAVFDFSIVASEETRTLVMIGVLPQALPEELQSEHHHAFDLSARHFPLEENTLTLWQEQDAWVVAITRGRELTYFQAMGEEAIGPRLLQDLRCLLVSLELREILLPLREVVVWGEATPDEREALRETLHLPVRQAERPLPQMRGTAWKLVPAKVTQARQDREARRWQVRGVAMALVVYLLFIAALVAHLFLTSGKVTDLQRWMTQHADALTLVHETRDTWNDLRPVVDEKSFPLELLLEASRAIPSEQLHLTLFESSEGHLLLKGEAKNVAAAFQFVSRLKKDAALSNYTWEMSQPHLLPNDLAEFQIEGNRGPGSSP
jgi:hypothetical protein